MQLLTYSEIWSLRMLVTVIPFSTAVENGRNISTIRVPFGREQPVIALPVSTINRSWRWMAGIGVGGMPTTISAHLGAFPDGHGSDGYYSKSEFFSDVVVQKTGFPTKRDATAIIGRGGGIGEHGCGASPGGVDGGQPVGACDRVVQDIASRGLLRVVGPEIGERRVGERGHNAGTADVQREPLDGCYGSKDGLTHGLVRETIAVVIFHKQTGVDQGDQRISNLAVRLLNKGGHDGRRGWPPIDGEGIEHIRLDVVAVAYPSPDEIRDGIPGGRDVCDRTGGEGLPIGDKVEGYPSRLLQDPITTPITTPISDPIEPWRHLLQESDRLIPCERADGDLACKPLRREFPHRLPQQGIILHGSLVADAHDTYRDGWRARYYPRQCRELRDGVGSGPMEVVEHEHRPPEAPDVVEVRRDVGDEQRAFLLPAYRVTEKVARRVDFACEHVGEEREKPGVPARVVPATAARRFAYLTPQRADKRVVRPAGNRMGHTPAQCERGVWSALRERLLDEAGRPATGWTAHKQQGWVVLLDADECPERGEGVRAADEWGRLSWRCPERRSGCVIGVTSWSSCCAEGDEGRGLRALKPQSVGQGPYRVRTRSPLPPLLQGVDGRRRHGVPLGVTSVGQTFSREAFLVAKFFKPCAERTGMRCSFLHKRS